MALTTRTIPSLMNGMSQQPAILRSPDQTEDEVNTFSSIAAGLGRRPPTQVVRKLAGMTVGDTYSLHHINRDVNERYLVVIKQGGIQVFDEATGLAKTVNAPHGFGYLDQVADVYRATSIADYTFIVNPTKTVALAAAGADTTAHPVTYRFPGGNTPAHLTGLGGIIFGAISSQYTPNQTQDGTLTGTVASSDKLPTTVCNGCVYKVLGDSSAAFVSYYVRGNGSVWEETVKPGLQNAVDATTMPWALVREADGTFTFAPFSWQPRRVGDEASNPLPPFVGRAIHDVFFYQNRLGFVVDDSVVFSGAGDYGDFFRRTVLDYIDSDTVSAAAAGTDVALLDYALPFADGVMLFSRQRQFSLTNGSSGLSAHSLAIAPVTSYLMAPNVRPTPMGSQAHFVTDSRGSASIQEFTRLAGADPTEAADVTAHVPHLIPQGASQLVPVKDLEALFVLVRNATDPAQRHSMFAYQFFWDGDKKLVSAWRKWDFGDGIPVSAAYESGYLFVLMDRPDGVYLEKLDLRPTSASANQDHVVFLDRQVGLTGSYNSGTNKTTWDLGYPPDPSKLLIVRGKGASKPAESVISPATYVVSGTTVSVPGDESASAVTLGQSYVSSLRMSRQFPQDWQMKPLTTGRLVLHTFTINVADTAYLRAEVYPYGTAAQALEPGLKQSSVFNPLSLGSASAVLGRQAYGSGAFTFSVAGNSAEAVVDLINDSPFGSTLVSAEWEGLFFSRAV